MYRLTQIDHVLLLPLQTIYLFPLTEGTYLCGFQNNCSFGRKNKRVVTLINLIDMVIDMVIMLIFKQHYTLHSVLHTILKTPYYLEENLSRLYSLSIFIFRLFILMHR